MLGGLLAPKPLGGLLTRKTGADNPMAGLLAGAGRMTEMPEAEAGPGGLGALLGGEALMQPSSGPGPPAPTTTAPDGTAVANPASAGAAAMRWQEIFPQLAGARPVSSMTPERAEELAVGLASEEKVSDLHGKLAMAQRLANTPDQYATPTNPWAPMFSGMQRALGQQLSRRFAGELAQVSGERRTRLAEALGQASTDQDVTAVQAAFGASPEEVAWRRDKIAADEAQRMADLRFDMTQQAQFVAQQIAFDQGVARDLNREQIAERAAEANHRRAMEAAGYQATIQQLSRHRLALMATHGNEAAANMLTTELGWSPIAGRGSRSAGQLRDTELEKTEMGQIAYDPELTHSGWAAANIERLQTQVTAGGETHTMPWGYRTVDKEGLSGEDLESATAAEQAFKSKFTMALLMSPDRTKFDALVKFHQLNGDRVAADPAMVQRMISDHQRDRALVLRAANKTGRTLQRLLQDPTSELPEDAFDWPDTAVRDRLSTSLKQQLMGGQTTVPPEWNVREDMQAQFANPTPDLMIWTFQELEKARKDPDYRPAFWPDAPADTGMEQFTRSLGDDLRADRTGALQTTDAVIAEFGENWMQTAEERVNELQGRFASLSDEEKVELRRLLTALTVGVNASQ